MTTGSHIYGNIWSNTLNGGSGNDTIYGYGGNDTITAGAGNDYVTGDDGKDLIYGENGEDKLYGGNDSDTIYGGYGNDLIDGGAGADLLVGGDGNDTIYGGSSSACYGGSDGGDTIQGGAGEDYIVGGNGPDRITGGRGNDTIYGGDGADVLAGGDGADSLYGGSGNDTIRGGHGNDTIDAGKGDDLVCTGDGDNKVYGGSGNDTIYSGPGNDTLYGGKGADSFYVTGGSDTIDGGDNGSGYCGTSTGADQIYITGPVTITLSPSVVIHANVGDSINLAAYHDYDGTITDGHGNVVTFKNIEKINVVHSIKDPDNCICFTPGTLIATRAGLKPVETLQVGDKVITRDDGMQEIRWIGARSLDAQTLIREPALRPVLIRAGSLGNGLPERDMMVSPSHRMLIVDERTDFYFGTSEVLVAAKHLVRKPGVQRVQQASSVTYIHLLFDRHEVILADGAWTESFQPGDYSLGGLAGEQRNEIFRLFPGLQTEAGLRDFAAARPTLKKADAAMLG